jgi:hypothetical protein
MSWYIKERADLQLSLELGIALTGLKSSCPDVLVPPV